MAKGFPWPLSRNGPQEDTFAPTGIHVDATAGEDACAMRFPVTVLMSLAAYFVWASTFADAAALP